MVISESFILFEEFANNLKTSKKYFKKGNLLKSALKVNKLKPKKRLLNKDSFSLARHK